MNFLDNPNNIYRYLVTNYHVISEKLINEEIEIELYNAKKVKFELDTNLLNIEFFKDAYDVTVIQIRKCEVFEL